jgi:beta-mannosidase
MQHRTTSLGIALNLAAMIVAGPGTTRLAAAEITRLDLGGKWQVVREGSSEAVPAVVPGCIHTDLLAAGKIPDPFYRDNEKDVQWIGEANWVYGRTFDAPRELLAREHVWLRCEGLDTLATIRVNQSRVAETDNMFRTYEFDVKRLLKPGRNEIEIRFASVLPLMRAKEQQRKLPTWNYPGSSYVRKEPCNFGWDWGPTLVTCGIWRPISLVAFDKARWEDVAVTQDHSQKGRVTLHVDLAAESSGAAGLTCRATLRLGVSEVASAAVPLAADGSKSRGQATLAIDRPRIWWPAGMGGQPLYTVQLDLLDAAGQLLDSTTRRIGLRTLRAVEQTPTAPMHFEVDGVPFFAKGANWIPADSFANRVTKEALRRYVDGAAEANMNTLRLWGGGYYEDDALYDLCDERGICLWVDLKFGCSTYPAFDPAFLDNVRREVQDNLRRLRHHPSIALWCGNNEIMFFRGGDRWTADKMSSGDYYRLFRDVLGGEVHRLAPQTDYVTGSPDCGDVHFWEVWHGGKPFEAYHGIHGFVSEFGFQSFAEPKTVRSFSDAADRQSVYSRGMKWHERSNRGYMGVAEDGTIGTNKIMLLVRKYFREPKDFESTLWLSQITQAYGIKCGAEGWRREMPQSMGCVFWQYIDCWPCTSWSSVDYFGRWKALQYAAKRFYAPLLVSGVEDAKAGAVDVFVTSDSLQDAKGQIEWTVTSVSGETLSHKLLDLDIPARTSRKVHRIDLQKEIKSHGAGDLLVWLKLVIGGRTVSDNLVTLVYPRELELRDPRLRTEITELGGDFQVTLTAAHPALWTWLSFDGLDARCSQNFVNVMPDAPLAIVVHPVSPTTRDAFAKALRVQSLYDTYSH